jgi:hypothetical protein
MMSNGRDEAAGLVETMMAADGLRPLKGQKEK